jgi:hypothetical protein
MAKEPRKRLVALLLKECEEQTKAFSSPKTTFQRYWAAYGGLRSITRSPYFIISVILGMFCIPWALEEPWWEKVIDVVPNMLGFTLGGYALLLALGSETFQKLIAKAGKNEPVLRGISASFMHFILIQSFALVFSIMIMALHGPIRLIFEPICNSATERLWSCSLWEEINQFFSSVFGFIGCSLLFYAVACSIAATFRIFRLVELFILMVQKEDHSS